MEQMKQV